MSMLRAPMLRSPEKQNGLVALGLVAVLVGATACSGDGGERVNPGDMPTATAAASASPNRTIPLIPKPRDVMELKQVPPEEHNLQRAWRLGDSQPWGENKEIQIDSRATREVGEPVGLYFSPRQEGEPAARVQDGDEFPAVCFVDKNDGAQYIRNSYKEGSSVWYQLDADRNGAPDVFVPAPNGGFTGLGVSGQPDGIVPHC